MKFAVTIVSLMLFFSSLTLAMPDYAEAARMGGGGSFGGRPSMSVPAQRPAVRAQQPHQNQAQATAPGRPGMGMMGGLFGGLLAGTLLGSILSGGGFNGGGLMDIILIGVLVFVGYMLFKRFRQRNAAQSAPAYGGAWQNPNQNVDHGSWNSLRQDANFTAGQAESKIDVPAGFDTDEFLKGAKMAYTRMQQSWDKRDLADIAQFATPAVMDVLKQQLAQDPTPGHTEIILVNANLLGVEDEGQNQRAQVYFDVLMREDPSQQTPANVREIWHFLRAGKTGNWKLDGIQQVA